jgi:hypothetical protein
MKSAVLKTFLLGATFGIGMTVLSLYTQKPSRFVALIEAIAEKGRARKVKEEQKELRRERLKAAGFLDEEIDEIF